MQNDMMTYGPIESSFDVYDDFISYKSGINPMLIKNNYIYIVICLNVMCIQIVFHLFDKYYNNISTSI